MACARARRHPWLDPQLLEAERRVHLSAVFGCHVHGCPAAVPAGYLGWMDAVEADGQVPWAAQDGVGSVRWRVGEQAGIFQPPGQFAERDLGLQPGKWCAEAVVDAATEAQVLASSGRKSTRSKSCRSGSRLPEARTNRIVAPDGIVVSATSMSSSAWRTRMYTGGS